MAREGFSPSRAFHSSTKNLALIQGHEGTVINIHSFSDNMLVKTSFDAVLANSTQHGTGVDTMGYRRAAILINGWTGSATTLNFTVSESADNSSFTVITGPTLGSAIAASTADAGTYVVNVDLAKRKRYIRVDIVGTGTAGNASAVVVLFEGENAAPTQDQTAQSI